MKQHHKPCATCPFTSKCSPGETGGSPAEVYVAQTFLPYWVPCHEFIDYSDPNWKANIQQDIRQTPQCVGHAIMRAKCGVADRMPAPLIAVDPYPDDRVFESIAHFYAYHTQIPLDDAVEYLNDRLDVILMHEITKSDAKFSKVGN